MRRSLRPKPRPTARAHTLLLTRHSLVQVRVVRLDGTRQPCRAAASRRLRAPRPSEPPAPRVLPLAPRVMAKTRRALPPPVRVKGATVSVSEPRPVLARAPSSVRLLYTRVS